MIRFAIIKRMIKSFVVEVASYGGVTKNRFISPKGIFSKPRKNETGLIFELSRGTNQDIVIAIQKEVELQEGDVIYTDDKNYIHLKYKDGKIEIQGDTVFLDGVTIKGNLQVDGGITATGAIKGGTGEFQTSLKVGTSELLAHLHGGVTVGAGTTAPLI